ncbi:DUF4823 domain-containing protein [Pantoea agglomerans]|uniref:DUF4823 domain-containing protein n=1 Tax=Pantoea TaxID=53335 RepID=UPI001FAD3A0D|nr:DUF4823 domain-containing protein [Pantoea sp. EKM10T]
MSQFCANFITVFVTCIELTYPFQNNQLLAFDALKIGYLGKLLEQCNITILFGKIMKGTALSLAAIMLAGCSAKYNQIDVKQTTELLDRKGSVLIAMPKDGFYDTTVYRSSGQETASAIQAAFTRHSDNVSISQQCSDIQCLKNNSNDYTYLVVPQILHWEDRATEWSMKPDKIEIKLAIYKSSDLSLLSSSVINGSSKIATWGGDHPQDLLSVPINSYISSLY